MSDREITFLHDISSPLSVLIHHLNESLRQNKDDQVRVRLEKAHQELQKVIQLLEVRKAEIQSDS